MTDPYERRADKLAELLRQLAPPQPVPPDELDRLMATLSVDALVFANNEMNRLRRMMEDGLLPPHAYDDACLGRIHEAARLQAENALPPRYALPSGKAPAPELLMDPPRPAREPETYDRSVFLRVAAIPPAPPRPSPADPTTPFQPLAPPLPSVGATEGRVGGCALRPVLGRAKVFPGERV